MKMMRVTCVATLSLIGFSTFAAVGLIELANYHEYNETLMTSGQPTREQFPAIAESGVQLIVNLAPRGLPGEVRDEEARVRSLGMSYEHIPVDWDNPSKESLNRFLALMRANAGKTVLVHCWVNARASGFVYVHRVAEGAVESAERKVVERIWANNPGYELHNVPAWQSFLEDSASRVK